MHSPLPARAIALLLLLMPRLPAAPTADSRAAVFFFGQSGAGQNRQLAKAAAAAARRLTIQGSGLPKDFLLQSPTFSLEYGLVRVGAQDFLLPLRSVLQVRRGKSLVRNETVFRNYRKFDASSQIRY